MIRVLIQEDGKPLAELEIEQLDGGSPSSSDFSVRFASDNGGGVVDLRQRVLYGFNLAKYNVLALVSEALNLLELNEMEWDVAPGDPANLARAERRTRPALSREADDQVRHHRPPFWRR